MKTQRSLAAYLSCSLSYGSNYPCILASLEDVKDVFFQETGFYNATIDTVRSGAQTHSTRLLRILDCMLKSKEAAAHMDAMLICSYFKVPAYHLLLLNGEESHVKEYLSFVTTPESRCVTVALTPKCTVSLAFKYLAKSSQENPMYRHYFHLLVLTHMATQGYTRKVQAVGLYAPSDPTLHRRVKRIMIEAFGSESKCYIVCGSGIVNVIYAMYKEVLNQSDHHIPPYNFTLSKRNPPLRPYTTNAIPDGSRTLEWFLAGNWSLSRINETLPGPHQVKKKIQDIKKRTEGYTCSVIIIDNDDSKGGGLVLHNNVQVAHIVQINKCQNGLDLHFRPLVRTLEKRNRSASNAYKKITNPDECLHTTNTVNSNIHGGDLVVLISMLTLFMDSSTCSPNRSKYVRISHMRSSTNSAQHGVMDINNYRWSLIKKSPQTYRKLDRFPVLQAANLALVHREALLIDEKDDPVASSTKLAQDIREAAEYDTEMARLVFIREKRVREVMDNHILGMLKIEYFLERTPSEEPYQIDRVTYDRMLIAQNPKMCLSEMAYKSKFDSESKCKASKKIKTMDRTKNRRAFLDRMNSENKDLFIDPTNTNSRGKWAILDRLHHSSDKFFYSRFCQWFISHVLSPVYMHENGFEITHKSLTFMIDEIKR